MQDNYSNFSYYQLKEVADVVWDNPQKLVHLHGYIAGHRTTDFALQLRDQIESRLAEIANTNWGDVYRLEALEAELEEDRHSRLNDLFREISNRVNELYDLNESFSWPSTQALPGANDESENYREESSLLSLMGYRTGEKARRDGLTTRKRREILTDAYHVEISNSMRKELPNADDWGLPGSSVRLKKIAYCSAGVTKDMKRKRTGNRETAIGHREADLAWLKVNFYDGIYDHEWDYPETGL